jgi:hypothetical protein
VVINSNAPYSPSTVLTVNGIIYASSIIYTGDYLSTTDLIVSSVVISTLSTVNNLYSVYLTTPSFAFNTLESKANSFSTSQISLYSPEVLFPVPTNIVDVNSTLYTTAQMPFKQKTGIRNPTPQYDLDVGGSLGTSSISTSYFFAPAYVQANVSNGVMIRDPYFSFANGPEGTVVSACNSVLATPSSLLVSGVLNINLSTQSVGIYTTNPRFTLDVQRQGYIKNLSTPILNTSLLFLTLQSA